MPGGFPPTPRGPVLWLLVHRDKPGIEPCVAARTPLAACLDEPSALDTPCPFGLKTAWRRVEIRAAKDEFRYV